MTTPNDLDARLARLRAEWPVGSMVDNVMARIGPVPPRRTRWRARLFAGLAASGLLTTIGLTWLVLASRPTTLLAAVKESLERSASAHVVIAVPADGNRPASTQEIWYRRGRGLRAEGFGQVIVEDGQTQWSWPTSAGPGETVVLRQRSPGFFWTGLASMLALPEIPGDWARVRSPERDREVDGRACLGYTVTPPWGDPRHAATTRAADGQAHRAHVLAGADGRIHEIALERRGDKGPWHPERTIRITYDVPVPPEKLALQLPEGARVIDADAAFDRLYPLDRALHRVELGGLILAVHDLQPMKDGEGFYFVSSVRGTREFLKAYPPRRRPVNPELVLLDVAFQPMTNRMWGAKYDILVLGKATRGGVEYAWSVIVPRRFFQMKDGKRLVLPENGESAMPGEPGRLDDLPGKARVPLAAVYWDEKHRDAWGVQQGVSTWVVVPIPPDRPPATLDEVSARARRDLLAMAVGGAGHVMGVAAGTKREGPNLRGISSFAPGSISDADFAAAVRRGLDDLRQLDDVQDVQPEDLPPPRGERDPKP